MLGKLFKHEWKTASKILLLLHGIILLFAVLSRIYLQVSGALHRGTDSVIAVMLIFIMILVIASAALFTQLYIAFRFYKSVFADQGYLTNTLPVTPMQLIVSKGLVGVLWSFLDIAMLTISVIILVMEPKDVTEIFSALASVLGNISEWPLAVHCTLLAMVLVPFTMIGQAYFSIAVGNLANTHKIPAAVGTYIGIYAAEQMFSLVFMILTGTSAFNSMVKVYTAPQTEGSISANIDMGGAFASTLNTTLAVGLIVSLIITVLFFHGTRYIMTKKLNLQ